MKSHKKGRLLLIIFLWPIYLLSFLVPRSKKIWVYGSYKNTFTDNSKYLFLKQHYLKNASGIVPVWITKSKLLAVEMRRNGYKSYTKMSLPGIFYCIRASVYVFSWTVRDINFWLSGGAQLVSLWHGIPFKMVGIDKDTKKSLNKNNTKRHQIGISLQYFLYPNQNLAADILLSTSSDEVSAIFKRTFATKKIIHSVYPRVEHFLLNENQRDNFVSQVATFAEKELIDFTKQFDAVWVYTPTFRDKKEDKENMYAKNVFDFDIINTILKGKNILLLVKYHYVAMLNLPDKEKYSNILFINPKTDMYMILPYTSGLITDYSSVLFDYMLLQKPILFYNFDIESYQKNSREFYYPYDEATCGMKIKNFMDLCYWFKNDEYKNCSFDYQPYIRRFWGEIQNRFLLERLYEWYNIN